MTGSELFLKLNLIKFNLNLIFIIQITGTDLILKKNVKKDIWIDKI
jgi:hypothetical protein